jgi:hypothetical protein
MSVTVIRMYSTAQTADNALKELKRHRFSSGDIHVVHPPAAGAPEGATVAAIIEGGVSRHRAERYAVGVAKGGSLVIVHPPFGSAAKAEEVLDHFGPVETGVPTRDFDTGTDFESDATPFSRMMGWKVLSHNPTPFSDALGWKVLSNQKSAHYPATFKIKLLSHTPAPLSRAFGMPVLSHKAAPFSAMLRLKTLSDKAAPFSAMLGLKTLSSKQLVLGDVKLSDNPAPLSSALGLPVLTKDQS